jgi:hypothetical protein
MVGDTCGRHTVGGARPPRTRPTTRVPPAIGRTHLLAPKPQIAKDHDGACWAEVRSRDFPFDEVTGSRAHEGVPIRSHGWLRRPLRSSSGSLILDAAGLPAETARVCSSARAPSNGTCATRSESSASGVAGSSRKCSPLSPRSASATRRQAPAPWAVDPRYTTPRSHIDGYRVLTRGPSHVDVAGTTHHASDSQTELKDGTGHSVRGLLRSIAAGNRPKTCGPWARAMVVAQGPVPGYPRVRTGA